MSQNVFSKARNARRSTRLILLRHISPVIIFAIVFNITKFISISPIGPRLQENPAYLKFIVFFQAFHPLTTTGIAPLFILIILNYKVSSEHLPYPINMFACPRFTPPCHIQVSTSELVGKEGKSSSWQRPWWCWSWSSWSPTSPGSSFASKKCWSTPKLNGVMSME